MQYEKLYPRICVARAAFGLTRIGCPFTTRDLMRHIVPGAALKCPAVLRIVRRELRNQQPELWRFKECVGIPPILKYHQQFSRPQAERVDEWKNHLATWFPERIPILGPLELSDEDAFKIELAAQKRPDFLPSPKAVRERADLVKKRLPLPEAELPEGRLCTSQVAAEVLGVLEEHIGALVCGGELEWVQTDCGAPNKGKRFRTADVAKLLEDREWLVRRLDLPMYPEE